MSLIFFGTQTDIYQVWCWLLDVPGAALCETYSRPDLPNRWFKSAGELAATDNVFDLRLSAWSKDFGGAPEPERVTFEPVTQRLMCAKGRTVLLSPAFINVVCNNDVNGCLASATLSFWTEKGARQRSMFSDRCLDSVDWKKFSSASASITRRLQKSSPAKMRAYSIMPDAWAKLKAGELKLWNWGSECAYPSELITERAR